MEAGIQVTKQLIVIQGPTASGKTQLSIDVAKHFKTIVLSADSRQFYREMSIGTAKPSLEEQSGIQHYFIDSHCISDEVSAAQFAKEAMLVLENEFKSRDKIVLAGGSGMFVDALINGLDEIPTDLALRNQLIEFTKQHGMQELLDELREKDPSYFQEVDQGNPSRIIRAIEAIRITGKKYSQLRTGEKKKFPYEVKRFIIEIPRETLYKRINLRVDLMMEAGLLDEVKSLLEFQNLSSMQTVGYKEFFDYFDKKISLEKAIELVKQHSRNYAKRQITWLKRYDDALHLEFETNMLNTLIQSLNNEK